METIGLRCGMTLFEVLHEDDDLLVLNKPAGLVCHPTKTDAMSSLISRVRLHLGPTGNPQLVNRLDRETSGVILVAKAASTARELGKLLENRLVEKCYLAIVHGSMEQLRGQIEAPVGKDERSPVAIKDTVRPDGNPACTQFEVIRRFQVGEDSFSLLRLQPMTGRKHQLRIHLASVGHSIVGDKLYGQDEMLYLKFVKSQLTPEDWQKLLLPNHALHAERVRFRWREREWDFQVEPEAWFQEFLGRTANRR